ncbi:hypothetical protein A2U01_0118423, partial [Trifolium medium]|nr:hypothetical protein [Trifolium medium]
MARNIDELRARAKEAWGGARARRTKEDQELEIIKIE